jgi:hypothetical protein
MNEKPIIFSGEMVRAILDGRKTQTRRVIKLPQDIAKRYEYKGDDGGNKFLSKKSGHYWVNGYAMWRPQKIYQVGDLLWVRETWAKPFDNVLYKANFGKDEYRFSQFMSADGKTKIKKWKSSMFMPKALSRIWLEVTAVRVEQVQDISEDDAKAEGVEESGGVEMKDGSPCYSWPYRELWDRLHGVDNPKAWESNPFVWVIEFKKVSK